jgi:hypothetical protein
VEQLGGGLRREPLGSEAGRPLRRGIQPLPHVAHVCDERLEVVLPGLDRDEERVERCDVDPDGVVAGLERLNERRPRAGERVEHAATRPHIALEQRLDELWHELAEIRVEPVDVLRPLTLRKILLRPGEREIELAVELCLGQCHG